MTKITAQVWFRKGEFCKRLHTNIVEGYRAEVIDDLSDGLMIYTGVCATRQEAIAELIGHLKDRGLSGILKVAH